MNAQGYPNRPIRVIATKGGSQDYAAHFLCPALTKALGQEVRVEYVASGFIPAVTVAQAPADGHTLLLSGRLMWLMQLAREDCPYDLLRDFAPIVHTTSGVQVLLVRPDFPARTAADLIALAKARPGQLKFASTPAGGNNHLAPVLLSQMAGIDLKCVECNAPERLPLLLSGEVQMFFTGICSFAKEIEAGIVKPIGLASTQRSSVYPELPTIAESGQPGYENITAGAIFVHAKTPPAIVKHLTEVTMQIMRTPEAKEYFSRNGYEAVGASPEALVRLMKADIARVAKVIKDLGSRRMEE